jgi:squalene-associated FAD-dependent desaturase
LAERDRTVAVLGGGLAGIAAALRCADAGLRVVLLEVRPQLGGAAYSVRKHGLTIDNGQHVFLRCCTAYRALLRRIGSESNVRLQERLEIPLLRCGRSPFLLRRNRLPAPLHLAGALMRFSALTPLQRVRAVAAVAALRQLDPADPALDAVPFGRWLVDHRQDAATVSALWDLLVLPTVNLRAEQASLAICAFVFQQGLLERADAGDIGFHLAPLQQTIGEPALNELRRSGVDVRLRWRAGAISRRSGGIEVRGRSSAGEEALLVDAAIIALPHLRAASLLQREAATLAERIARIGVSPIVNLHVLYDREVTELPFAAGLRSPLQYIFDRTLAAGAPAGTQYLAVSLSGAEQEMTLTTQQLRERYLPEIGRLLPAADGAKVLQFLVTREHAATFRASPGSGELRPGPSTPVPGLMLAGAWTATGWPATMEGAVRSGQVAADSAIAHLSSSADVLRSGRTSALRVGASPR